MTQGKKLIILGAGCSVNYGYPAAADMANQLKQFADSLGAGATRLAALVRQTTALFDRLRESGNPVSTIDELSWVVHQQKVIPYPESYRAVEAAKVAVNALFLSKEAGAARTGLSAYRSLMRRIFPTTLGTRCEEALSRTEYRVLTFNYDRLFELAFCQHFNVDRGQSFYGPKMLNSGLFQVEPKHIEVDMARFSLLKLHGSTGVHAFELHGECEHAHGVPDPRVELRIVDDEFFLSANHGSYSNAPKPVLIVFPHEKDLLKQHPQNALPYRVYIPKVWDAAYKFAAQAEEIWVIGYSCPETDFPAVESLLGRATDCKRVVIQNPSAVSICERLKHRLDTRPSIFSPFEARFGD